MNRILTQCGQIAGQLPQGLVELEKRKIKFAKTVINSSVLGMSKGNYVHIKICTHWQQSII